jgi:hypothetical protein
MIVSGKSARPVAIAADVRCIRGAVPGWTDSGGQMKRPIALAASIAAVSAALSGCYVVPVSRPGPAVVPPAPVIVAPAPPPPGVVIIGPTYPAPAIGYAWGWHPSLRFFGWYHPRYGWHRR